MVFERRFFWEIVLCNIILLGDSFIERWIYWGDCFNRRWFYWEIFLLGVGSIGRFFIERWFYWEKVILWLVLIGVGSIGRWL